MKAYYGKNNQPRRSKDKYRQSKAVVIVASYQAIKEAMEAIKEAMEEESERVEREAVQDVGAILYALVPIHIGQQYVEKWNALMKRVLEAEERVSAQQLERWYDEEEEKNVHPPEKRKQGQQEEKTDPAEQGE